MLICSNHCCKCYYTVNNNPVLCGYRVFDFLVLTAGIVDHVFAIKILYKNVITKPQKEKLISLHKKQDLFENGKHSWLKLMLQ